MVDEGLQSEPIATTLLELVRALGEVTEDDREVVATIQHLLESGRVRLTGNFHDLHAALFRSEEADPKRVSRRRQRILAREEADPKSVS